MREGLPFFHGIFVVMLEAFLTRAYYIHITILCKHAFNLCW